MIIIIITIHLVHGIMSICRARSVDSLVYELHSSWDKLTDTHHAARKAVGELLALGTDLGLLSRTVSCCLRPDPHAALPSPKCDFCGTEETMEQYEYNLFDFNEMYGVVDLSKYITKLIAKHVTLLLLVTIGLLRGSKVFAELRFSCYSI